MSDSIWDEPSLSNGDFLIGPSGRGVQNLKEGTIRISCVACERAAGKKNGGQTDKTEDRRTPHLSHLSVALRLRVIPTAAEPPKNA
jgi:hypothetical protein